MPKMKRNNYRINKDSKTGFRTVLLIVLLLSSGGFSMQKDSIVLGGGCFWCVEAVFQELKGVVAVNSGYAGGDTPNPTYKQVSRGETTHAEVVKVTFDPEIITVSQILRIFFHVHDPTTPNRQGNDVGPQYRSIILYADDSQKKAAQSVMSVIENEKLWSDPLVTQLQKLDDFWPAEDYHQDYFSNNPNQPYCNLVIVPKLKKFRKEFADMLRPSPAP